MIFDDHRGALHALSNLPFTPSQVLISENSRHVFRGLHQSPYAKYIYVISGSIQDVYIDVDNNITERTLVRGNSMYIPANTAHGYYCIEASTVLYALDGQYDERTDRNIYYGSPEFHLSDIIPSTCILSEKDRLAAYKDEYDYLLLGSSGFLGSEFENILRDQNKRYLAVNTRTSNLDELRQHIKKSKCKYVVCAAGISGRPTIEWCETNEKETYNSNYLDMLQLMRLCEEERVHLTIFGSGLIYDGDQEYVEEDPPNNHSKVYSRYRIKLEEAVKLYVNVLYLRILYPVSSHGHPKCFVTKMRERAMCVNNIAVPLTVIPDLFPQLPKMIEQSVCGIFNFVNEGTIKLPKLLELVAPGKEISVRNAGNGFGLSTQKLAKYIHVTQVYDALINASSIL